jgi:hypothetical protein
VNSRIIVDSAKFSEKLPPMKPMKPLSEFNEIFNGDISQDRSVDRSWKALSRETEKHRAQSKSFGQENDQINGNGCLTDQQLMLCTPIIGGFCLGSRKWGKWALNSIILTFSRWQKLT